MKKTLLSVLIVLLLIVVGIFYRRGQQAMPTLSQETMTGAVVQSTGLVASNGDSFSGAQATGNVEKEIVASTEQKIETNGCTLAEVVDQDNNENFDLTACTSAKVLGVVRIRGEKTANTYDYQVHSLLYFTEGKNNLVDGYLLRSGSNSLIFRVSDVGFGSIKSYIDDLWDNVSEIYNDEILVFGDMVDSFLVIDLLKKQFILISEEPESGEAPVVDLKIVVESSFIKEPITIHYILGGEEDSVAIPYTSLVSSVGGEKINIDTTFDKKKREGIEKSSAVKIAMCYYDFAINEEGERYFEGVDTNIKFAQMKQFLSNKKIYCKNDDDSEGNDVPGTKGYIDLTTNTYVEQK